jgi:hypothetical protein
MLEIRDMHFWLTFWLNLDVLLAHHLAHDFAQLHLLMSRQVLSR